MYNLDNLINKIEQVVESHYLGNGGFARYLWQDEKNSRKMGVNEYGCADALNILYTICKFPTGEKRELCLNTLLDLQDKESGLFIEHTHHFIHTTAHCVAALDLFDEKPKYPQKTMLEYFTKDGLKRLLDSLDWYGNAWPTSHKGAGVYVVGTLTENVDIDWQNYYFDLLFNDTDEKWGMSKNGAVDTSTCPPANHLFGWFHYMFNMEYAKRPLKYPEKLIDTCIYLYDNNKLRPNFGKAINFAEVDWVYALNRAIRQSPHRFYEAKSRLRDFATKYVGYLESLDFATDDGINDLHMLFGAVCALAEIQNALPGEFVSTKPLRLVLDRRPFI